MRTKIIISSIKPEIVIILFKTTITNESNIINKF